MIFDDVLKSRRSIRKYLEMDVEDSLIDEIIWAGAVSPSAHNRQPWKVKVLRGADKDKISSLLMEKSNVDISVSNTASIIKEVPVLFVIFYDKGEGARDNDMLSIGSFIENMHLKVTDLGLGSLWIANTNYIKKEISEYLNVSLECVSCFALGYKNQDPKMRPRKDIEEIVI